ncbi:phospholipase D1/2 [Marchantia polymorpha subsp. ruderalis]
MASYLLHGMLHVTIYEADGLVDEDRQTGSAPLLVQLLVATVEDTIHLGRGGSQLYATVDLGKTRVGRTRMISKAPVHPVWNETFRIHAAHTVPDVAITVKDDDTVGATIIGRACVPAPVVLSGNEIDDWFDLVREDGSPLDGSRIRFRLKFVAAADDKHWSRGINPDLYTGVPFTFFPQRTGCRVTLYQDAHMLDGFMPHIALDDGLAREPSRCWEDVYQMIVGARHLIYITGWSVYTEIRLVRDEQRMIEGAENVTLGELLKRRAAEGVTVNMLVWDDRTSGTWHKDGVMATHDEDTELFFRNTNVNCVLCPRNPDEALSIVQDMSISLAFTHHQKSIVVDAPVVARGGAGRRRIVSFVGGLDLCDGRWDTQQHSLFGTLAGAHRDDFHQPNFAGASIACGGPREPWHDIHSRIEGEAAWDILYNFEQRWRMQAGDAMQDRLVTLVDVADMDPPSPAVDDDDPEAWNVQIFRSIDGGAVELPESPREAAKSGLVTGKNNVLDRSIQDGYVSAIRRAKHSVYIENQYFIGSAYGWDKAADCPAPHLIPMELTRKIVSKIEANERFAVYVVMPMWPEAVPDTATVQEILQWTHLTMQMMYKEIGRALHARDGDNASTSPRDYLNFYCLGNRETKTEWELEPSTPPAADTNYKLSQDARRFLIYVHAKLMIVDDEYVIVGSANINERSMNGARDSEIAMGAYQPYRVGGRGQVHGFRMSLWYEHLGRLESVFVRPGSLDCVRTVNALADELWSLYMQDEPCDLPGHLLPFPVAVAQDGAVTALPGFETFPDTKAPVLGAESAFLPPLVTA